MSSRKIPPVKYRRDGRYEFISAVDITNDEIREAEIQGRQDADKNSIEVSRTKATDFEKTLQKRWGKRITELVTRNAARARQWGQMLRNEIEHLGPIKNEFIKELKKRDYKVTDSSLSTIAYCIILLLITMVELPINIAVFGIFGENLLFTLLMAAGLSGVFALLSHFIGGWIKGEGIKSRSIALVVMVVFLLGIIAWVRLKFFAGDKYSPILDYFKTDIELDIIVGMFFVVNLLLFIVSIISSYHHHDSDPLFTNTKKKYYRLFEKAGSLFSAMEHEMSNLHGVNSRCQECFKELRHIYTSAYTEAAGVEPTCFKEAINVDLDRIPGVNEKLAGIEKYFKEMEQMVKDALEPINFS